MLSFTDNVGKTMSSSRRIASCHRLLTANLTFYRYLTAMIKLAVLWMGCSMIAFATLKRLLQSVERPQHPVLAPQEGVTGKTRNNYNGTSVATGFYAPLQYGVGVQNVSRLLEPTSGA